MYAITSTPRNKEVVFVKFRFEIKLGKFGRY